ncbi:glycosyl hydrolase [Cohnella cellulosilytica]|uniref:Glycosyl hydrolase n=1 Tax=Cohnella cellulosilytica TaxID=986710 RepID=A0ABW2F6Z5_9BACL
MSERKEMDWRGKFVEPTSEYRPAPLWVWNDEMEPESIRLQLQKMADKGYGGAFVHPRPGLITPYLSEEWFILWGIALEEAERLGLKLYIYDENSYPSGFAGGHVPSELPDCLANCVLFKEYKLEELDRLTRVPSAMLNRPGKPIRAFAMRRNAETWEIAEDVTLLPAAEWTSRGESFWVFELGTPETNNWLGGFAYTDLLRPEVTEHFLRTTHEQYRSRFGDRFGTSIPALFTDEPEISPGNLFQEGADFLPFSYWFASEFAKRNGYDLLDYLPFLFRDAVSANPERDAARVRYDFYATIHQLWTDNSVRPISEWCERNGIAYTGHYLEHNWPHPFHRSSPAVMSMYEYMHWPAIDMLLTHMFRDNAPAGDLMAETSHLAIGIREVHSAANQFDRPRVLCEAFGAGGWDASFEDFKRIGDWLYANGINFLNPHLTYSTIVGARKRDHPQSFDWRQPWWDELRGLNDYFSRLSFALSEGKTYNRILVLNPTTSSFLFTPGDLENNESYKLGIVQTRELAQRLIDAGWDYDWCDEYIMARHGSVSGEKIQVANRAYDVVIVPPGMLNAKSETVELLRGFMAGGGRVIAWNDGLSRKEGRSWQASELTGMQGWISVDGFAQTDSALRETLRPRSVWRSGIRERAGVTQLLREMDDGSTFYFIVNSFAQRVEDTLIVPGRYGEIWDPLTGSVTSLPEEGVAIPSAQSGSGSVEGVIPVARDGSDSAASLAGAEQGQLAIPVSLAGSGSLLIRVYPEKIANASADVDGMHASGDANVARTRLPAEPSVVTPEQPNIFPISYCDLTLGEKTYSGLYTTQANRFAFEYHGFSMNPWDNGVQFKRRLLDRESSFDERTGFAVQYRFRVAGGGIPEQLELMVERPELYDIRVNGIAVELRPGTCWLDHHMGQASIREAVREGENVIRLEAKPFSIFMEIEAVYLTGDFSVTDNEGEWVVGKPERGLAVGAWKEQGYPFYGSAFVYSKRVNVPAAAREIRVALPDWRGTIASVQVNGKDAGMIGLDHDNSLDITPYAQPGATAEVTVRVSGSFKNLMGPHFDPSKPRNTAWPGNWKRSPMYGPPPAREFDLIDYGLFADFVVEVLE